MARPPCTRLATSPATSTSVTISVNRFFGWCVKEGEREDNPVDLIDPSRIPDMIQPFYQPNEIESLLKSVRKRSEYELRDTAVILTLLDTGVRAAELCRMRTQDVDWRNLSIKVGWQGRERALGRHQPQSCNEHRKVLTQAPGQK